jgi:hypothetical protein
MALPLLSVALAANLSEAKVWVRNDGTSREAPGIAVSGVHWEDAIDAETARRLADLLMTAADEVDRWAQR